MGHHWNRNVVATLIITAHEEILTGSTYISHTLTLSTQGQDHGLGKFPVSKT